MSLPRWARAGRAGFGAVLLAGVLAVAAVAQAIPPASGTAALAHVTALSQQIGPRVAGTPAYLRAADYVAGQFERLGYRAERQVFSFEAFEVLSPPSLTVTAPVSATLHPVTLIYSASTPPEGLEAELVSAGVGRREDFARPQTAGRIVLVERGQLFFWEKVANAEAAGASAVVVYNTQPGVPPVATLRSPAAIPAVIISQEEGRQLLQSLASGPVRLRLVVRTLTEARTVPNVIGIKPGSSIPDEIVVVGGHLDSVPGSPGANDNASGVAAVLEAARLLAEVPTARTVHFIAFGGEEIDLLGSQHYVRTHTGTVVGMINLDMVGHGPQILIGNGRGNGGLLDVADRVAAQLDIRVRRLRLAGGSDHFPFERAGVPVVFIHTGDEDAYHTPMDVVSRVDPQLLAQAAGLAAGIALELAR